MKGGLAILLFGAVGVWLGRPAPSATAACPHPYPGGVLDCLRAAYAARDTGMYASVLAEDFHVAGSDSSAGWSRDEDVRGIATLFASSDSIDFEITGPITILDGPSPRIWILDKVATALTVFIDRPEGKTGWRTDNLSTFTVREASPPDSGYEIVEWKQLEGN